MPALGQYVSQTVELIFQNVKYFVVNYLSHNLPFFSTISYYLVHHPKLINFKWQKNHNIASSPTFLIFAVLCYLSITLLLAYVIKLPPLKRTVLKPISAVHSLILTILSTFMALGSFLSIMFLSPNVDYFVCFPKNTPPKGPIFFWTYIFYLSKIYEYVDTLLIILSKSMRRLSFLHVYHHVTVPVMCYFALETSQSMFPWVLFVNATVHVVMYYYYFLCAIGVKPKWKKLVTDCQIVQFIASFAIMAWIFYYHFTGDGCSGIVAWSFDAVFISTLLALFLDFRYNNYQLIKNKKAKGD